MLTTFQQFVSWKTPFFLVKLIPKEFFLWLTTGFLEFLSKRSLVQFCFYTSRCGIGMTLAIEKAYGTLFCSLLEGNRRA